MLAFKKISACLQQSIFFTIYLILLATAPLATVAAETKLPKLNDLAFRMAESTFQSSPNQKNFSILVDSAEKLLADNCFSTLHKTLVFDPQKNSAECQSSIDNTLAIDDENPLAICARDGLEASSCREASSSIIFAVLYPNTSPWDLGNSTTNEDLDTRLLETGVADRIQDLEIKLNKAEMRGNSQTEAAIDEKKSLKKELLTTLNLACKVYRLSIKHAGFMGQQIRLL